MSDNEILDAALNYVRRGIPVFPCNPETKAPLTTRGFKDASIEETKIRFWWATNPDAMIGMPTGAITGRLVVDIDPIHGGDKTLAGIIEKNGATGVGTSHITKTGSGGSHIHYRQDGRFTIGKGGDALLGIDHRGDGGYIIVAPSLHPSGNRYEGEVPDAKDLLPIPEWLASAILDAVKAQKKAVDEDGPIAEGGRNDTLFRKASRMRSFGMENDEILMALTIINEKRCNPPLSDAEVQGIVNSVASRYEPGSEVERETRKRVEELRRTIPKPAVPPNEPPANANVEVRELSRAEIEELSEVSEDIEFTDAGSGKYIAEMYNNKLRYIVETGKWMVWDNTRWLIDESDKVALGLAESAMRARLIETVNAPETGKEKLSRIGKCLASLNEKKLKAALSMAATRLPVTFFALDSQPNLLNVSNGTIDLRTGALLPHKQEHLLTKVAGVKYNEKARCDRFLRYWEEALPGISLDYLKRWFGYSITGENREKRMQIWEGRGGNNGKSIAKNALLHVFGDYAIEVSVSVFVGKNRDYKNDDLVGLKHKRLVFAAEPEDGAILNSSLVKRLTGMDRIHCRPLHSNSWINYEPTFKPIILTNHELRVPDTDNAFWRRPDLIRFDRVFEGSEDDKMLGVTLKTEGEGILLWVVQGAIEWYEKSLPRDQTVVTETNAYRKRQDTFGDFLDAYNSGEITNVGGVPLTEPRWPVPSDMLRKVYNNWASNEKVGILGRNRFKEQMLGHGYVLKPTNAANVWVLRTSGDAFLPNSMEKVEIQGGVVTQNDQSPLRQSFTERMSNSSPSPPSISTAKNVQSTLEKSEPALKPVVDALEDSQARIRKFNIRREDEG